MPLFTQMYITKSREVDFYQEEVNLNGKSNQIQIFKSKELKTKFLQFEKKKITDCKRMLQFCKLMSFGKLISFPKHRRI